MAWRQVMQLSETATLLFQQYGALLLNTKQLAEVLHYKTTRCLLNAINDETCPVFTFRLGKFRVADIRDVAEYIDSIRRF